MIDNLCQTCAKPEYAWNGAVRVLYKPQISTRMASKRGSKGRHRVVESFTCSSCIITQLRKENTNV